MVFKFFRKGSKMPHSAICAINARRYCQRRTTENHHQKIKRRATGFLYLQGKRVTTTSNRTQRSSKRQPGPILSVASKNKFRGDNLLQNRPICWGFYDKSKIKIGEEDLGLPLLHWNFYDHFQVAISKGAEYLTNLPFPHCVLVADVEPPPILVRANSALPRHADVMMTSCTSFLLFLHILFLFFINIS